jgi:predicted nucleic-acid-binding protein
VIGLDTNVLVRLITADDFAQAQRAREFVSRHCSQEDPAFIATLVLAEAVWVLQSNHGMGRAEIAQAIERLLTVREFAFEDDDVIRGALETFARSSVGFTDLLILGTNRANACDTTATFDRRAAKLDGFTLIR